MRIYPTLGGAGDTYSDQMYACSNRGVRAIEICSSSVSSRLARSDDGDWIRVFVEMVSKSHPTKELDQVINCISALDGDEILFMLYSKNWAWKQDFGEDEESCSGYKENFTRNKINCFLEPPEKYYNFINAQKRRTIFFFERRRFSFMEIV